MTSSPDAADLSVALLMHRRRLHATIVDMFRALAALAALLGALLAPAPAAADEPRHGFAETTVCVVRTDPAIGWRVGAAIRAWNAAQQTIRLTEGSVPGCGVIEIREYAERSDRNGYADWPRWNEGQWMEGGRWGYHHAEVWLNHTNLADSFKPRSKDGLRKCWRKRVVAHELGHALGLDHTTGSESVMSYEHDVRAHCGQPSEGDAATLAALYSAGWISARA